VRISDLVDLIERALIDRPEQTARELALALGGQIPKNLINSALYGHLPRFQSDGATPPRWRVDTAADRQTGRATDPLQKQTNGSSPALYRWQEEALTAWRKNGRVGIIQAVTGTGKTRLGVEAIREQLAMGGKAFVP
jgi:ATP-dependent helicase YprA (DUF1998 family)